MKRIILVVATFCFLALLAVPAWAVSLSLTPTIQEIQKGSTSQVALVVAGLDLPDLPLGGFDVNITYDPGILSLTGFSFGDPVLGDLLDVSGFGSITDSASTPGFLNLYELSLDDPYDLAQAQQPSFTLATVQFSGLDYGFSSLDLSGVLTDAIGETLSVTFSGAGVNVSPVAEPGTMLLLVSGLAGLAGFRRFF